MPILQEHLLRLIAMSKEAAAVLQDPGSQAMAAAAKMDPMSGHATITPIKQEEPKDNSVDLQKKDQEIQKWQGEAEKAKLELQKEKAKAELIKTHQQNLERSKAEREKLQKEKEKLKADMEVAKAQMQQAESEHTSRLQDISSKQRVRLAEDRAKSMMSAADQNAKAYVKMTQDAAKDSNAFFADKQKALNDQQSAVLKDKDSLLKDKEKFMNDKLNRPSGLSPLLTKRLNAATSAAHGLSKLRSHLQGMNGVYMSKASAAPNPVETPQQPQQPQPQPQPQQPQPQYQAPANRPLPTTQQPTVAKPAPQQPAQQPQQPAQQPRRTMSAEQAYNSVRGKYNVGDNATLADIAQARARVQSEIADMRQIGQNTQGAERYLAELNDRFKGARRQVRTAAAQGDANAQMQQKDYDVLNHRATGWFTRGNSVLQDMRKGRLNVAQEEQRKADENSKSWWRSSAWSPRQWAPDMLAVMNPLKYLEESARNADTSRYIANTYGVDQNAVSGYSGENAEHAGAMADAIGVKQSWGGNAFDQGLAMGNAALSVVPGGGWARAGAQFALGGALPVVSAQRDTDGFTYQNENGQYVDNQSLAQQYYNSQQQKTAAAQTHPVTQWNNMPVVQKPQPAPTTGPAVSTAQATPPQGMTAVNMPRTNPDARGTGAQPQPQAVASYKNREVGEGGDWVSGERNRGFFAEHQNLLRSYRGANSTAMNALKGIAGAMGFPLLADQATPYNEGNLGKTTRYAAAMRTANTPVGIEASGIHGSSIPYGQTRDITAHTAYLKNQYEG